MMEVTLTMAQVDAEPPECPHCAARAMRQEFRPVALGGSNSAKAHKLAENIIETDYNVADFKLDGQGGRNQVRYKDKSPDSASSWGLASEAMQQAVAAGRQNRLKYGNGLDALQSALKSGDQPDLIELSKARMRKEKLIL